MTVLYISSLIAMAGIVTMAIFTIHRAYIHVIDGLRADNKDLRDRLFQKNALPPSGVDLTEKYEARNERERERRDNPREKKPLGPIEQLAERWASDDRVKMERRNIDATRGKLN